MKKPQITTDAQKRQYLKAGKVGAYSCGGGLYLKVSGEGRGSWVYRYQKNGKRTNLGLGDAMAIPLTAAREIARIKAISIAKGINPAEQREQEKQAAQAARKLAKEPTFEKLYRQHIKDHAGIWSQGHARQWQATWDLCLAPVLGTKTARQITTADTQSILMPMWVNKPETARRTRSRIDIVWRRARAQKLAEGESPANTEVLSELMPKLSKAQLKPASHPALPHAKAPEFWAQLAQEKSIEAAALRLLILTACRASEIRFAQWSEFDLDAGIWRIPAERMKARTLHEIPLTDQMLALLKALPQQGGWVFPSPTKRNTPIHKNALYNLMRRLHDEHPGGWLDAQGVPAVIHGWRSCFRDWCAEETDTLDIVAEIQLAHVVGNEVERCYRRTNLTTKRRELLELWEKFVSRPRLKLVAKK